MKRKLQVFVSSTFTDLRDERQAAVEAILKAGHIPAGMELFTAGSESQLDVIRRWIEESDVYLLILGGRYGSIEPKSGLSYTEVEFDYARSLGKPFFAAVIADEALEARGRQTGALESAAKLALFRAKVTSQMCAFFDSPKDVKLAVFESLPGFVDRIEAGGWVAASQVTPSEDVARQLTALLEENAALRQAVEKSRASVATGGGVPFERLKAALEKTKVTVPRDVYDPGAGVEEVELTLLKVALVYAQDLARGVSNAMNATSEESFLFHRIASHLVSFGLAEEGKVPTRVLWQRLKLSKEGIKFLTWARLAEAEAPATPPRVASATADVASGASTSRHTRRRRKKT